MLHNLRDDGPIIVYNGNLDLSLYITTDFLPEHLKAHAKDTPMWQRIGIEPFQGDILLSDETVYEVVEEALNLPHKRSRLPRAATSLSDLLWDDAVIPYEFSTTFRELLHVHIMHKVLGIVMY